jgi:Short C-terminal domain/Phospholipase_D-nuclease N-terminal
MTIKELVARFRKPALPLLAVLAFLVAGCNQVGGATMTFWDVIWAMIFFYFWFMCIWIWISVLMDIFRRNDMSGVSKAIWILVVFVIPLFGALIYMITRPKVTAQDVQIMTQADAAAKAASQVSSADQIEKLNQLLASGAITQPEYETLKAKAIAG